MPGYSGLDMLRELDALLYPAPILIVSGQRDVPTAVSAIKGGALDFIEKPIEAASVVARVREAIMAWTKRPANGKAQAIERRREASLTTLLHPGIDRRDGIPESIPA